MAASSCTLDVQCHYCFQHQGVPHSRENCPRFKICFSVLVAAPLAPELVRHSVVRWVVWHLVLAAFSQSAQVSWGAADSFQTENWSTHRGIRIPPLLKQHVSKHAPDAVDVSNGQDFSEIDQITADGTIATRSAAYFALRGAGERTGKATHLEKASRPLYWDIFQVHPVCTS